MTFSIAELAKRKESIDALSDEQLKMTLEKIAAENWRDNKEEQIRRYRPVSKRAELVHKTRAKVVGVSGGNGSSKTESCLVEIIALATGVFPMDYEEDFQAKFRGAINCRVVVESLTTTLHPIILPKLQYTTWTGVSEPGGDKGHWGWVPRKCLINGSWQKSWSEKLRMLTVHCYDPKTGRHVGDSRIQFMSHDQDPSDFASGDFHIVLHDEPPMEAIWVENEARTMRVNGRMLLAMTWPDDPAAPTDWIFDRIHDRAGKDPINSDIVWFELHTHENQHLNQEAIASQAERWDETMRQVRLFGKPIRFSNLIHADFTDRDSWWCFKCGKVTVVDEGIEHPCCMSCRSLRVCQYNHVQEFEAGNWPVIWCLDPHPRKPHMFLWAAVDPHDDVWIVAEGEVDGQPDAVHDFVLNTERALRLNVVRRIMDPNMGRTSPGLKRTVTWQDEFHDVGLACELADDSDVGRSRVNEYLKPDPNLEQPRLHFHERCSSAIFQMKRFTWDEHKRVLGRDIKQKPREKFDDYPALLRYLMNTEPTYHGLVHGHPVVGPRRASRTIKGRKRRR